MLIDSLALTLAKSGCLSNFWGSLDEGGDGTLAVASSARPFIVAARFARVAQPTLVIVPGEEASVSFARNLAAYLGEARVMRFVAREDFPFNPRRPDARAVARRAQAAWALACGRRVCVVASAASLVRMMPPACAGALAPLELRAGCELGAGAGAAFAKGGEGAATAKQAPHASATFGIPDTFEALLRGLEARGYENTGELDGPGTFCVRGGTVDVFPGNLIYPVRLDFFGDELEEIRRIIPSTGQTIQSLEAVEIYPVTEFPCTPENTRAALAATERAALTNKAIREVAEKLEGGLRFDGADVLLPFVYKNTATLGDYVTDNALVSIVEPRAVIDDAQRAYEDAAARAKGSGFSVAGLYAEPAKLNFGACQHATYVSIMRAGLSVDDELPVKRTDVAGAPERLFEKMSGWLNHDFTCVFSAPNLRSRKSMELSFVEHNMPICQWVDADEAGEGAVGEGGASGEETRPAKEAVSCAEGRAAARSTAHPATPSPSKKYTSADPARLKRGVVNMTDVDIPLGMVIPKARLAMLSVADTQGARAASRKRKVVDITKITFPYAPGDYVVHAVFGVALFKQLVTREIDGGVRDYLELEYAEGDKLFLPVEQLDRVTRYVGAEGSTPRLTRLNTSDWQKSVSRARKATKKLAFDLVDVYTRRSATHGFQFEVDTAALREMEEAFPYEETPDQLEAIADVKDDMASAHPMDRLVCGDVGFGKTEVAMRAAMIAAQNGKQVMVLCPTTILAQQHFNSFSERLSPFAITVDVLSRFKTDKEQRRALEDFASGKLAVLIGTHRLLSKDVNPHDLGLVIIDEEQRFGVGHKEQFKNMRESIDVLTLSATPIPRTMQMAVSGVREMSLIMTPPGSRKPIKVHVGEWDPDVVSGAIRRELARGGQLYYVSNRVRTIDEAVSRVMDAAPEARVGVVHGKMSKDEIERVMEEFSAAQIDVLVATTIVESGIDNPHTNTLIIEDSQRLGLAQMYQLKGRVGRSNVQAYAYFMFPEEVPLTPEAEARLIALDEHQELGAGMQIALRDLEIRGAGSMLGAEQSGNLSSVGFDLFAQMLNEAVAATRDGGQVNENGLPPALSDITINVAGSAFLSEEYIPDTDERVLWYRRLSCATTPEAVEEICQQLKLKHDVLPVEAENLIARSRLKALANEQGIRSIIVAGGNLTLEPVDVGREKQTELRRQGARYLTEKRKLTLPCKYFKQQDNNVTYGCVFDFCQELYNVSTAKTDGEGSARAAADDALVRQQARNVRGTRGAGGAGGRGSAGSTSTSGARASKAAAGAARGRAGAQEPAVSTAARGLSAARKAARQAARAGSATPSPKSASTTKASSARVRTGSATPSPSAASVKSGAQLRAGLHKGSAANVRDATVGSVRSTKTNPRKLKRSK